MSTDTGQEPTPQTEGQEPAPEAPQGQAPTPQGQEPSQEPAEGRVDELPQWSQNLIKSLRTENAQHRSRYATAQQQLTDTSGEAQGLQRQINELQRANVIQRVALEKGLNSDMAERLRGESYEELSADADKLRQMLGGSGGQAPPPDFGGGARPNGGLSEEADFNSVLRRAAGRSA